MTRCLRAALWRILQRCLVFNRRLRSEMAMCADRLQHAAAHLSDALSRPTTLTCGKSYDEEEDAEEDDDEADENGKRRG